MILIALAGVGAGAINAVVGSGTLITFPTLVALGYPPVTSTMSNAVGLVAGSASGTWGYRRELRGQWNRLAWQIPASFVGAGVGAWLLLQEGQACTDPLAAAAPLVFAFSPLVGSPLTTSAKFAVVSKSPLTDRINDSLASSGFAIAGKRCGCDAIVIVGRATKLSALVIDGGRVRLEAAEELGGATCQVTESHTK